MQPPLPTFLLIASALILHGCDQQPQDVAAPDAHTHGAQETVPPATTEALPAVTLDNGQRWKANAETTAGIANMVGILGAYDPANGDTKGLKTALEQELGLIFERCTMTGEAHEQLHNYLLPIHHQLSDFEATEAQRQTLGEHLAAYGTYFE